MSRCGFTKTTSSLKYFYLSTKGIIVSIAKDIIGCKNEQGEMVQCKKQNIYQRNAFEQSYDQNRYDLMDIDLINEP